MGEDNFSASRRTGPAGSDRRRHCSYAHTEPFYVLSASDWRRLFEQPCAAPSPHSRDRVHQLAVLHHAVRARLGASALVVVHLVHVLAVPVRRPQLCSLLRFFQPLCSGALLDLSRNVYRFGLFAMNAFSPSPSTSSTAASNPRSAVSISSRSSTLNSPSSSG